MERSSEVLAFCKDGAPAQARLKTFQAYFFKQALIIINRDSTTRLLETLDKKYFYASQIIIIPDNASYHYSIDITQTNYFRC